MTAETNEQFAARMKKERGLATWKPVTRYAVVALIKHVQFRPARADDAKTPGRQILDWFNEYRPSSRVKKFYVIPDMGEPIQKVRIHYHHNREVTEYDITYAEVDAHS